MPSPGAAAPPSSPSAPSSRVPGRSCWLPRPMLAWSLRACLLLGAVPARLTTLPGLRVRPRCGRPPLDKLLAHSCSGFFVASGPFQNPTDSRHSAGQTARNQTPVTAFCVRIRSPPSGLLRPTRSPSDGCGPSGQSVWTGRLSSAGDISKGSYASTRSTTTAQGRIAGYTSGRRSLVSVLSLPGNKR